MTDTTREAQNAVEQRLVEDMKGLELIPKDAAERDKAAAVAAAYERAAIEVNARGDRARVLALSTPEQKNALAAMLAEAEAKGRRGGMEVAISILQKRERKLGDAMLIKTGSDFESCARKMEMIGHLIFEIRAAMIGEINHD